MPDYRKAAVRAAQKYGVDPKVFLAMINQESGFNPTARSSSGARGIAQFMPGTAKAYGVNLNDGRVTDDLEGAARYIAANLRQTGGNYHQALSIYNSGRPDAYKDPTFAKGQTYNYVRSILAAAGGGKVTGRGATGKPSAGGSITTTKTVPGVDNSQERRSLVAAYISNPHDPSALTALAAGLLGAKDTPSRTTTSTTKQGGAVGQHTTQTTGGIAVFEGTKVPAWMVPALQHARSVGWQGKVTSGVRTYAEQAALYAKRASNPYPVAKPGQSNHEIDRNGGAIDVSDPSGFANALSTFTGQKPRQGTAIGDPIHFSRTGR